jgi:plastocyanin
MISTRRTLSAIIFFCAALALFGTPNWANQHAVARSAPPTPYAATVTLKNFSFTPKVLRVKAGTAVTWKSAEGSHTVTADDGSFRSPTLNAGQTYSFTFAKPGTYRYYCSFHGSAGGHDMAGSVIVAKN